MTQNNDIQHEQNKLEMFELASKHNDLKTRRLLTYAMTYLTLINYTIQIFEEQEFLTVKRNSINEKYHQTTDA